MVDAVAAAVDHGPFGEQRGPAPADVLKDRRRSHDVQVRVLLAREGGRRQVLRRGAGSHGVGGLLAGPGERLGDRLGDIVRDGGLFDDPADVRAECADRLLVVRIHARQLVQPIVDRRRLRHGPPVGVRRHAEARRYTDVFDPGQGAQMRALAAHDGDPTLVNLLKIQHVPLGHLVTVPGCVPRRRVGRQQVVPHFRRLWPRPTIVRGDPGLAASPPARYNLRVARRVLSLPLPLWPCACSTTHRVPRLNEGGICMARRLLKAMRV